MNESSVVAVVDLYGWRGRHLQSNAADALTPVPYSLRFLRTSRSGQGKVRATHVALPRPRLVRLDL